MAFFNHPQMIKPGKDQCGNCHAYLGDDQYCRYCGTKAGEGAFEPYMNYVFTVRHPLSASIHAGNAVLAGERT